MPSVFRLQHVSMLFRREIALSDLSLEAEPGVVLALLGENGAGKTTAIRILLGLLDGYTGQAEVLGFSSRSRGITIRRQIGYVPEQPVLYEWMTVDEIGWFAAGFYPPGYQTQYREYIKRFALPRRRKIKALSKGMRAKVALSLALASQPKLLVLDEPTSGLDSMVRREFLESMVDVAAEGRTVLLSSHQIDEVERVADVIAILHRGRLKLLERLDRLKQNVREVTLTCESGPQVLHGLPGQIIHCLQEGRQLRFLAHGFEDASLDILRRDETVGQIAVRTPSLDDIIVAYVRGEDVPGVAPASSDSVREVVLP